jgi:hypothetical protein
VGPTFLDLTQEAGGESRWEGNGLTLFGAGARLSSSGPATKITAPCKSANEVSAEAWIAPAVAEQVGPARIVSLSNGPNGRNFTLGVGDNGGGTSPRYVMRVENAGAPFTFVETPPGTVKVAMQHVVATAKFPGRVRVYVGGVEISSTMLVGDLSAWNDGYALHVGGEQNETNRRFLGTVALVAVYCVELSAAEVSTNLAAGPRP